MKHLPVVKTVQQSLMAILKNPLEFAQIWLAWAFISLCFFMLGQLAPTFDPMTPIAAIYIIFMYVAKALMIFPFAFAAVSIIDHKHYEKILGIFPAVSRERLRACKWPFLITSGLMLILSSAVILQHITASLLPNAAAADKYTGFKLFIYGVYGFSLLLVIFQIFFSIRFLPLFTAIACNITTPISTSWNVTKGFFWPLFCILILGAIIGLIPWILMSLIINHTPSTLEMAIFNFINPASVIVLTIIVTASLKLLRAIKV